jgi:hypothetical protein
MEPTVRGARTQPGLAGERNFLLQRPESKSARETPVAHRDREPGMREAKIPAETACFQSTTDSAVWKDWMVGAPGLEPGTR